MTTSGKPRVLIVNDDGIDGPGIRLLEELVGRFTDDIWVVAPDEERSGAGHSISVSHPIRVRQRDERHFAIKGSPTDCALLGIHEFLDRRPDILFSGINAGPNLAEDVTYSGTCSAAMEGAMLGIPAVALSQMLAYQQFVHWETSRAVLPPIIERLMMSCEFKPGSFVNVNVPNLPFDQITGTQITRQGRRPPGSYTPKRRIDERFVPYYWIKIAQMPGGDDVGTDLEAVRDGAVSITPLQLDMTNHAMARDLERSFADMIGTNVAA